jgi:hypothetical protein
VARTIAQYNRQRERRIARKIAAREDDFARTLGWPVCGWCGSKWNPSTGKTPVWLGKRTCPQCEYFARRVLHNLVALKIVKLRKSSKLLKMRNPTDWGRLGEEDPNRPWLKWDECVFCTIPQCINNNDQHQVRFQTYKGHLICRKCKAQVKRMLPQLVKMKYLRVREP